MTSPLDMAAMQAGASEQSGRDLQNQLGAAASLRGKNVSPEARAKKLREACEGFESIFIQKMWQEMRNAVPKGGMFQGREEKFWQDMYDQELSKSMTRAGGIGLADMMYAQLSRSLGDASKSAAESVSGAAFTPGAAPLLPSAAQAEDALAGAARENARPAPLAAAGIYDGEAPAAAETPAAAHTAQASPQPVQTGQAAQGVQAGSPAFAQAGAAQASFQSAQSAQNVQNAQAAQGDAARQAAAKPVKKASRATGHNGDNPLNLAQIARRDAGDKLGARAVRPALHPQRAAANKAFEAQPVQAADTRPGTPEDLQRAMAAARGAQTQTQASATPLADMVARIKAGQLQGAQAPAAVQGVGSAGAAEAANIAAAEAPRKVTYTTNIPKNSRASRKGQRDAIRLLNVENAGPNSKAGRGIAAYHAQAAEAAQSQNAQAAQSAQPVQPAQPAQAAQASQTSQAAPLAAPAPLTAADAQEPGGYAIPPLTSGDLGGSV